MPDNKIFVFGSNLVGRHGLGAANWALLHYGAIMGIGIGRMGNSYAIPTKGRQLEILPLDVIQHHVEVFINYAKDHPALTFILTRIGCGYARYKDHQIAPLFKGVPNNVEIPKEWLTFVRDSTRTDVPSGG
jgi:hypothetical protein